MDNLFSNRLSAQNVRTTHESLVLSWLTREHDFVLIGVHRFFGYFAVNFRLRSSLSLYIYTFPSPLLVWLSFSVCVRELDTHTQHSASNYSRRAIDRVKHGLTKQTREDICIAERTLSNQDVTRSCALVCYCYCEKSGTQTPKSNHSLQLVLARVWGDFLTFPLNFLYSCTDF